MLGGQIQDIGKVPIFSGEWLIDSGATSHYTVDRAILQNFKIIPSVEISTGKGGIYALGTGEVTLQLPAPLSCVIVKEVLWVPDLAGYSNLLSVPQLTQAGYWVLFEDRWSYMYKDNKAVALGSFRNRAYYLDTVESVWKGWELQTPPPLKHGLFKFPTNPTNTTHLAMLSGTSDTQPIDVWHRRLGYLNKQSITKLTKLSTDWVIGEAKPLTVSMKCYPCLKASQLRSISKIVREPQDQLLGCVHIDLKGPCIGEGIYGYKYFMACTDEESRFTKAYPLVKKSDAFGLFWAYHVESERETGVKLLQIQFNGGMELLHADFQTYCGNTGIKIRVTAPYTPQMNGIAERMNQTLTEHASAMLWTAELPIGFRASAILMTTFLKDRSPTKALEITPYEAFTGKVPNLGYLRTYGCKAKVAISHELRRKTDCDAKSSDCILIGYYETANLYKLWDAVKGTIIQA